VFDAHGACRVAGSAAKYTILGVHAPCTLCGRRELWKAKYVEIPARAWLTVS
jgi:hypothetical protein